MHVKALVKIPYYPEGVHVTAVDLSSRMLQRAHRVAREHLNKRVTLLEMNVHKLDLPDDTFDETIATFVFCSVPDPVLGLREALRVTRPGGRLLLLEHVRLKETMGRIMDVLVGDRRPRRPSHRRERTRCWLDDRRRLVVDA